MGGYIYDKVVKSKPRKTLITDHNKKLAEKIQACFKSREPEAVNNAYVYFTDNFPQGKFIDKLVEQSSLEQEVGDTEIEAKLNLITTATDKAILDKLSITPQWSFFGTPYIKEQERCNVKGAFAYYGLGSTEGFAIISTTTNSKKKRHYIKTKDYERETENLLCRTEKTTDITSLQQGLDLLLKRAQGRPITHTGTFHKNKHDVNLLNAFNGRIFSMTVGVCTAEGRNRLVQIEFEYCNTIKDLMKPERSTVEEDVTQLQKHVMRYFSTGKIGKFAYRLEPTKQTKFAWLAGKEQPQEEERVTPLERIRNLDLGD